MYMFLCVYIYMYTYPRIIMLDCFLCFQILIFPVIPLVFTGEDECSCHPRGDPVYSTSTLILLNDVGISQEDCLNA